MLWTDGKVLGELKLGEVIDRMRHNRVEKGEVKSLMGDVKVGKNYPRPAVGSK